MHFVFAHIVFLTLACLILAFSLISFDSQVDAHWADAASLPGGTKFSSFRKFSWIWRQIRATLSSRAAGSGEPAGNGETRCPPALPAPPHEDRRLSADRAGFNPSQL